MGTYQQARNQARVRLHRGFAIDFRCYANGPAGATEDVTARLHTRIGMLDPIPGAGAGLSEFRDIDPRLVFLREEHVPVSNSVYVLLSENGAVDRDGVFVVEEVDPPDGVTITARCAWAAPSRRDEYIPAAP